jgi:hypothetical protein
MVCPIHMMARTKKLMVTATTTYLIPDSILPNSQGSEMYPATPSSSSSEEAVQAVQANSSRERLPLRLGIHVLKRVLREARDGADSLGMVGVESRSETDVARDTVPVRPLKAFGIGEVGGRLFAEEAVVVDVLRAVLSADLVGERTRADEARAWV